MSDLTPENNLLLKATNELIALIKQEKDPTKKTRIYLLTKEGLWDKNTEPLIIPSDWTRPQVEQLIKSKGLKHNNWYGCPEGEILPLKYYLNV